MSLLPWRKTVLLYLQYDVLAMETRLSSKGQIVVPGPLRRKLGLHAGDVFDASIESGHILLTPQKKKPFKKAIAIDVTGLPVLTVDAGAPELTSRQVDEILANFP